MIGPWAHNMSTPFRGRRPIGDDSSVAHPQLPDRMVRSLAEGRMPDRDARHFSPETWHAMRAEVDEAPVHIFVMGVNRWRDEQDWPLARARIHFVLPGERRRGKFAATAMASLQSEAGAKRTRRISSPTIRAILCRPRGGAVCCDPKIFPWGPMDQRPVEKRKDVLVYTSAPLKQDLEVTGPIRVVLYASTSAPDTDFTAKLVDVFPNGEARNLTDGILRVRYRHGLDKPELAAAGRGLSARPSMPA